MSGSEINKGASGSKKAPGSKEVAVIGDGTSKIEKKIHFWIQISTNLNFFNKFSS